MTIQHIEDISEDNDQDDHLESVSDHIERSLVMADEEVDGMVGDFMQQLGCSKKEAERYARIFQVEMNDYWS